MQRPEYFKEYYAKRKPEFAQKNVCEKMCVDRTKQVENLRRTLEAKKRIKELFETNPDQARRELEQLADKCRRKLPGISSTNAGKARKFKKNACEICGSKEKLLAHHKNKNQSDNNPENIQTLCSSCHHEVHGLKNKGWWE